MRWHFSISNKKSTPPVKGHSIRLDFHPFLGLQERVGIFQKKFLSDIAVDLLTRASFLKSFVAGLPFNIYFICTRQCKINPPQSPLLEKVDFYTIHLSHFYAYCLTRNNHHSKHAKRFFTLQYHLILLTRTDTFDIWLPWHLWANVLFVESSGFVNMSLVCFLETF